jgi:hypothetical protein
MRKSVTTFTCDGCGKKVESARDLRNFTLVLSRRGRGWEFGHDSWAELCDECEARLIATVEPILGSGVVDLRREKADEKTKTTALSRSARPHPLRKEQ